MKKIKLYAIGNEGKYNYYIFEKKQEMFESIAELILKVFSLDIPFYRIYEQKGKTIRKKRDFEKMNDYHESFDHDKKRIDVFYGRKRVFLTILCPLNLREEFNEELGKISYMPKDKK